MKFSLIFLVIEEAEGNSEVDSNIDSVDCMYPTIS